MWANFGGGGKRGRQPARGSRKGKGETKETERGGLRHE